MQHYRNLDTAFDQLERRRPIWLDELATLNPIVGRPNAEALATVIRTVNADPANVDASDGSIRQLVGLGRRNPDAITLLVRAFAPRLRAKISRGATDEFHADALANLAIVCLEGEVEGRGLAWKLINRAHNRTWRQGVSTRHRGAHGQYGINPQEPEVMAEIADSRGVFALDPADHVARVVDLDRFAASVRIAIDAGVITETTWTHFRDFRLARALCRDEAMSSVTRSHASRAAVRMQPLIDSLLSSHAA
jgi:hypothetical protein